MDEITVWTKQHRNVLDILEHTGRYTARRAYVDLDLEECAPLVQEVYDWLAAHLPGRGRPADAEYPVWVSYAGDAVMLPSPGTVILELCLPRELVTPVNIEKWGAILNYSYIPRDRTDARRHRQMLADWGVSDAKAYLSRFYPQIKEEIVSSWDRLFDDDVILGGTAAYGTVWEVRKEWIQSIAR